MSATGYLSYLSRGAEFSDWLQLGHGVQVAAEGQVAVVAVHLHGADSGDNHHHRRGKPCLAALDIHEFLGAKVGPKARLGHDIIRQLQCHPRRDRGVRPQGQPLPKGAEFWAGRQHLLGSRRRPQLG